MSLAAGDLNRLIEIQARSTTKDALNQAIDTWTPVFQLWSKIVGATGMGTIRQASTSDGVTKELNSYSFRIRYRPTGIDSGMRVSYAGKFFNILQVRHDYDRHEWTDLVTEVGGRDG